MLFFRTLLNRISHLVVLYKKDSQITADYTHLLQILKEENFNFYGKL